MLKHINQADQNLKLLDYLINEHPDCFFDWKVTISFYIAIHLLKALAEKRGKPLGSTHEAIFSSLNPKANPRLFSLPNIQWNNYYNLYQYSRIARYDGFENIDDHEETQKTNFEHAAKMLQYFIKYIEVEIYPGGVRPQPELFDSPPPENTY